MPLALTQYSRAASVLPGEIEMRAGSRVGVRNTDAQIAGSRIVEHGEA